MSIDASDKKRWCPWGIGWKGSNSLKEHLPSTTSSCNLEVLVEMSLMSLPSSPLSNSGAPSLRACRVLSIAFFFSTVLHNFDMGSCLRKRPGGRKRIGAWRSDQLGIILWHKGRRRTGTCEPTWRIQWADLVIYYLRIQSLLRFGSGNIFWLVAIDTVWLRRTRCERKMMINDGRLFRLITHIALKFSLPGWRLARLPRPSKMSWWVGVAMLAA